MSEQQISLKSVYDLRVKADDQPVQYRIPAYQRGYRWTPLQVTQLLEDIRRSSEAGIAHLLKPANVKDILKEIHRR